MAYNYLSTGGTTALVNKIKEKVDKKEGYDLSSNDYTKDEKDKLKSVETNATYVYWVNVD